MPPHSLRPVGAKVKINRSPILLPLQGVGVYALIPRAPAWAVNWLPFQGAPFRTLFVYHVRMLRRHVVWLKKRRSGYRFSHSSIHSLDEASLGMRQSPRGLRQQLPTLGPSGRQLRLNCCAKKRLKNVLSQCFMTSSEYSPVWPSVWLNAFFARKKIFEGRKPFRRT